MSSSVEAPESLEREPMLEPLAMRVVCDPIPAKPEAIGALPDELPALTDMADTIRHTKTDPLQHILRPYLFTKSVHTRATAKIGLASVGAQIGAYGGSMMGLSGFLGTSLTAGICTVVAPHLRHVIERRTHGKIVEQLHAIQSEARLPIEPYYNKAQQGVELRMFADDVPVSTGALHQELILLKRAAHAADATSVTVPLARVQDFVASSPQSEDEGSTIQSSFDWLVDKSTAWGKKFDPVLVDTSTVTAPNDSLTNAEEQQLINLSRTELDALCEQIQEKAAFEPLSSIMRVLSRVAPDHPLIAQYELLKQNKTLPRDAFRRAADFVTSRRLDDVAVAREEVAPGIHQKLKQSIAGRLEVSRSGHPVVTWRTPNLQVADSAALFEHIRMTPEMLTALLQHPEIAPASKIVEICEIAVWLSEYTDFAFQGLDNSTSSRQVRPENDEYSQVDQPGMQERAIAYRFGVNRTALAKELASSRLAHRVRIFRSLLAVAIIGFSSTYAADVIDDFSSDVQFNNDHYSGSERALGETTYAALSSINDTWNGFWFDTAAKLGFDPYMFGKVRPDDDTESALDIFSDSYDRTTSSVGNVDPNRKNKPEFWIRTHGGMDSEGYWAQSVLDYLEGGDGEGYNWNLREAGEGNQTVAHEAALLPGKEVVSTSQPALEVSSRHFAEQSSISDPAGNPRYGYVFHVPVLEGTRIVAAELPGHPDAKLTLQILESGIQQIVMDEKPASTGEDDREILTYWLVPDDAAPVVRQSARVELSQAPLSDAALSEIWHGAGLTPEDEAADMDAQIASLQSDFTYAFEPIRRPETVEGSYRNYLEDVLRSRKANCNVASTVLTISNPTETAPVTGFMNHNTEEQRREDRAILSTAEAHMWNTTPDGTSIDGTPPSDDNSGASREDDLDDMTIEDTEQGRDLQAFYFGMGSLSLGLAAAATVAFRKEIRNGGKRATTAVRQARQSRTRARTMDAAYGAISHAFYAAPGEQFDPRASYHAGHGTEGLESIAQNLRQQGRRGVSAPTTDKQLQRHIKRANRIIRRLQAISK